MDKPRIGSLFSGVGGLDLGLHWAGFETAFFVEINPYCQKVLNKNFPGVPVYENIKEVDFSKTPQVDGIVGGFPCQPASVAGKRRGANDERWLWPEFARAIRAVRPKFVIIENVPGLLTVDGGRCFQEVLSDLVACGLDVEWTVFPASALGAWHRRERLWIVAYAVNEGSLWAESEKPGFPIGPRLGCACEVLPDADRFNDVRQRYGTGPLQRQRREASEVCRTLSHADCLRLEKRQIIRKDQAKECATASGSDRRRIFGESAKRRLAEHSRRNRATAWNPLSEVCRISSGTPNRVDRIRGLGNAVVPQCSQFVGECLLEFLGVNL